MLAEVFAGRIGSPLDPGMSLFELDPSTGQLVFLAGNNNTGNPTEGTDGTLPLFTDSALADGLTAGDYYLAVADGIEHALAARGPDARHAPAIFDPNQPGSAQNGWSTRPLSAQPAGPAEPRLRRGCVASSPSPGQVLARPRRRSPCSSRSRSTSSSSHYQAFEATYQTAIPAGLHRGEPTGRNTSRDSSAMTRATNTATFQMLDGLAERLVCPAPLGPGRPDRPRRQPAGRQRPERGLRHPLHGPGAGRHALGQQFRRRSGRSRRPAGALPRTSACCSPTSFRPAWPSCATPSVRHPGGRRDAGQLHVPDHPDATTITFNSSAADLPAGTQLSMTDGSGEPVPLGVADRRTSYIRPPVAGDVHDHVGGWAPGDRRRASPISC